MWHFFKTDLKVGSSSQYEVRLASLSEGEHERVFTCDTTLFSDMENCDVLHCDVQVTLHIRRRGDIFSLRFVCKGSLAVPCDRCLDPLEIPVDTTYDLQVRYGLEFDDSADNILVLPERQTILDVEPVIYTTLMLCIPLQKHHAPGRCNPEMAERLRSLGADSDDDDPTQEEDGPVS